MSERRSDHQILSWTDYRGREQERTFRMTLDVRDFLGTPGYSLLLMAANTDLGVPDIQMFLDSVAEETPGVARSASWLQKRRWLFQQPGTKNPKGVRADADGLQEQAYAIMREHPRLSLHKLRELLTERGITRSREWIRKNRVTAQTAAPQQQQCRHR